MQFLLLVYVDDALMQSLPEGEYASRMRHCFEQADAWKCEGALIGSQQLEAPATARTVRVRDGRRAVTDGPFAETKEVLAGFNLIEAASLEDAVAIAQRIPWTETGAIEVRPVRDMHRVRRDVGAAPGDLSLA